VVDTGGGSTEYAIGDATIPDRTISCEIGAVRLTEAVPQLAGRDGIVDLDTIERARHIARDALAPIGDFDHVKQLAFVGGSATTAAAVVRGKKTKFDTFELTRADLQRALVRMCALSLKERRAIPGMKPQRADILPAGIIVLETVLDLAGHDRAVATTADLLLGYLLLQRDHEPGAGRPRFGPGWRLHERPVNTPAH
jgi:exopolyphosphatase/guanosine-5'-triphosphate,3'-diphosphate pyrophosphatase